MKNNTIIHFFLTLRKTKRTNYFLYNECFFTHIYNYCSGKKSALIVIIMKVSGDELDVVST